MAIIVPAIMAIITTKIGIVETKTTAMTTAEETITIAKEKKIMKKTAIKTEEVAVSLIYLDVANKLTLQFQKS